MTPEITIRATSTVTPEQLDQLTKALKAIGWTAEGGGPVVCGGNSYTSLIFIRLPEFGRSGLTHKMKQK